MFKCYVVNIYGRGVRSPGCNVSGGGAVECYVTLYFKGGREVR
jgi:hypothetical protein